MDSTCKQLPPACKTKLATQRERATSSAQRGGVHLAVGWLNPHCRVEIGQDMGVNPKIGGKPPKLMVYNGKPH